MCLKITINVNITYGNMKINMAFLWHLNFSKAFDTDYFSESFNT